MVYHIYSYILLTLEDDGEEVNLGSEEEPEKEERDEKNDIFEDSKPVAAPEPIISPPVKEETPKLPVTQSSTAVETKVTSRKSTDVSKSYPSCQPHIQNKCGLKINSNSKFFFCFLTSPEYFL